MLLASQLSLAVRAIRQKFRLLTAYDTFWPAAFRGGKLLARGRVAEFTRRFFNELPDARDESRCAAARTGPPIFLAGHVLGHGGYDHLVHNILKGLTESGLNVCRDRRACFRKQLVPAELRPAERRRKRRDVRLAIAPPHLIRRYRPDARTVAFTMWETDTLPAEGVRQLNRCGLVIVPSMWGAQCFHANGVKVPIAVVPLGFDPAIFTPLAPALRGEGLGVRGGSPERLAPPRKTGSVTFGTAGALDEGGLRKNIQRVIELFREAFPAASGVRLRVKITPNSPPVNTHGDPRIEVIDSHLPSESLAQWYRSLDAFVNASAGEGFGLHLLEAMACGVPLISSTFGGVGAFFDSRVGYEVSFRPVGAWGALYRGTWSEPDGGEIVGCLRHIARHREQARRHGIAAAERALKFRWEDTIRKLVIVLIQSGFIGTRSAR